MALFINKIEIKVVPFFLALKMSFFIHYFEGQHISLRSNYMKVKYVFNI